MKHLTFALALSACVAQPAYADGFKDREIAFQALNAADAATTCHAVGSGQAIEGNPLAAAIIGERFHCFNSIEWDEA